MIGDTFSEMASQSVARYSAFLDFLRAQSDLAVRRDPTSETVRNETISVMRERARAFISLEQAHLNEDVMTIARRAHDQAVTDLELSPRVIDDRFANFIFQMVLYTTQQLAAQVERDVVTVSRYLALAAQRIDMKVRSGRHTQTSALASVMLEDRTAQTFRFVDRMGRNYKATKHIRDTYRLHLLNTYNEVYMDVMAEYGVDELEVYHPDPNYKWAGTLLSITGEGDETLFYDVRDAIFHPGSDAVLSIPKDD